VNHINNLKEKIIASAIAVHREPGPGLLELDLVVEH
jgi:hypothetical protein